MSNKLLIKRSSVAAKVPATTDLDLGEIGVNTYDGKLFIKRDNGTASIVEIGAVRSVAGRTGVVTLAKTDVGLENVDNTADTVKPVSTATQIALDAKAPLASPALTGTPTAPTAAGGTNTTQIATTGFVAAAVAAASGMLLRAPQVLTSGTSYTTPAGCTEIYVEAIGAGAGGNTMSTTGGSGYGGGAGAYCAKYFAVSPSTAYSYAIGAGGAAGSAGGNTTFTVGATTITAGGGQANGTGGTASNGDLNVRGGAGGQGATAAVGSGRISGAGGRSVFGGEGGSIYAAANTTGNSAAANSGSGGSGGVAGAGSGTGGSGAAGFIRIWEFT